LINQTQPDTIDERTLNVPKKGKKLNPWETKENLNLVINSAKAIGCHIVNIHAADFMNTIEEHKEYLVLGVVWQVVKMQLLSEINLQECPELAKLLREGEELQDFMKLPAEDVLLRWINHHIQHINQIVKIKIFPCNL
jgi:plastin-1